MIDPGFHLPEDFFEDGLSSSSPAFLPSLPLTTRTPSRSSSCMTHSRVGFGRIVERQALVKAFARAHFSSASVEGNVPRAIVLPAHYVQRRGMKKVRNTFVEYME